MVLDCVVQQAAVEKEVNQNVHEAYPSEKRRRPGIAGNFAKRTRRSKTAAVNAPAARAGAFGH